MTDDATGFSLRGSIADDCAWPWQEGGVDQNGNQIYLEHQRGWWPYSWIVLPITPAFDVKAGHLQPGQRMPQMNVWVFKHNSWCPELNVSGGFGLQPGDTWGSLQGGKGCWGAKLSYDFTFVNTSTDGNAYGGKANLGVPYIDPNHPPSVWPFWTGACQVEAPTGYVPGRMPNLQLNTPSAVAELSVVALEFDQPIYVPPGGSIPVRVSLMSGGGSSLPVILEVVNVIDFTDNQGTGN